MLDPLSRPRSRVGVDLAVISIIRLAQCHSDDQTDIVFFYQSGKDIAGFRKGQCIVLPTEIDLGTEIIENPIGTPPFHVGVKLVVIPLKIGGGANPKQPSAPCRENRTVKLADQLTGGVPPKLPEGELAARF